MVASSLSVGVMALTSAAVSTAAEIWEPATGTFTPTGSPAYGRAGHTATLLPDGRVLIVGGFCWHVAGSTPAECTAGAPTFGGGLQPAELWDAATGSFSPAASPTHAYASHGATLLHDGRVLVEGVFVSSWTTLCPSDGPVASPSAACGGFSRIEETYETAAELFVSSAP